jgi:hypothetical protein
MKLMRNPRPKYFEFVFRSAMRKLALLIVIFVIENTMASGTVGLDEKTALCNQVRQALERIRSLHIRYVMVCEYDGVIEHSTEEWAFSGERLFLKQGWPTRSGDPPSNRDQIGVWDGKCYKLYDTLTQNGYLRKNYNPRSAKGVPFKIASIYTKFFGTYSEGTLLLLLDENPVEKWQVEILDFGSTIKLSLALGDGVLINTWHIDTTRGYMVQRHEVVARFRSKNEIRTNVVTEAVKAIEIQEGIWLPVRILETGKHPDSSTPTKTQLAVQEIKVNDPEIEEVFSWQFPEGSTYYDYNIRAVVVQRYTKKRYIRYVGIACAFFVAGTGIAIVYIARNRCL